MYHGIEMYKTMLFTYSYLYCKSSVNIRQIQHGPKTVHILLISKTIMYNVSKTTASYKNRCEYKFTLVKGINIKLMA
jgi:hypothetical protein